MAYTVAQVAEAKATEVNNLIVQSDDFVNLLRDDSDVDFSSVGDIESLDYMQWDFDAELNALKATVPGYLTNLGADADADIDAISALEVPSVPSLSLPAAAIPSLDAERPTIVLPDLPSTDVGLAPTDVPAITDAALPDAPQLSMPAVPTFEELQIPAAPSISLPTFSSSDPINTLVAPTAQFSFVDEGYTSELRDPLVAKLLYDLENGGYGIEPSDEAALWSRARDRAEAAGRLSVEAALKRAGATSFPMPTGALYADLQRARADVLTALSDMNREIALKRGDLYVENRKFTIQQVESYEKIDRELYNAIHERALNASKAIVELGIASFDATVRNFNAQLDAHKTAAAVFETRIRAELAKAEIYKTQIDAERLRGEFNKNRADLYQAQLNGIQTTVNLYKTRLEAVNTFAQIQAQKVDIFKTRVEAYATRVRAKASEFDMYRAAVEGQTARLDIYKTDIGAYEAKIRGEEARTRVLLQGNEALLQRFKAQVEQYRAQLEGKAKQAEGRTDILRTQVAAQGVNVQVYRSLADAILAAQQLRTETRKMNNTWNIATLNSRVDVVKFRLAQLEATMKNRGEIDKYGAKFYGDQLMALRSAVSGLSTEAA